MAKNTKHYSDGLLRTAVRDMFEMIGKTPGMVNMGASNHLWMPFFKKYPHLGMCSDCRGTFLNFAANDISKFFPNVPDETNEFNLYIIRGKISIFNRIIICPNKIATFSENYKKILCGRTIYTQYRSSYTHGWRCIENIFPNKKAASAEFDRKIAIAVLTCKNPKVFINKKDNSFIKMPDVSKKIKG